MDRVMRLRLWILIFCVVLIVSAGRILAQPETAMTDQEFAKLDAFEAHSLQKADKVFNEKNYRQAGAEYDSFLLEFPKSPATAYALLRKARCLHLDQKRFEAIKEYNEVLDYFPNDVKMAGAALYYIGLANWENSDAEKAMKAWAEMAEDKDYSKHPLAASAIAMLADNLVKQNKWDQAATYYTQVSIDFRDSNPEAANYAIRNVVPYFIRIKPDEPKFRDFYVKVRGIDGSAQAIDGDIAINKIYWTRVIEAIRVNGTFNDLQSDQRDAYYKYWASAFEGKMPDWDEFQINWANYHRVYEKDTAAWVARLDAQFNKYQKPDNYGRVVQFIRAFGPQKDKVQEYFQKLDFAKMTNPDIFNLFTACYETIGDKQMAHAVFAKFRQAEIKQPERSQLVDYCWNHDGELVKDACLSAEDKAWGNYRLLEYYRAAGNIGLGLPQVDQAVAFPAYAKQAMYIKGDFLFLSGKNTEAIAAYQQADNPPTNLFQIAEAYVRMGKLDSAVAQLREVENFFKPQAPEAGIRIAHYYRDAGVKDKYISALRGVLKKYPESGPSSQAHQELEALGVNIGGGVDAD